MSLLRDAFYRTVFDAPGGPESLAPRMGMTPQVLRNKANVNSKTNKPMLDDADLLMTFTGDYQILDALAANQGRVCIPVVSSAESSDLAVLELVARVWMRSGDVGAAVNATLADGRVEQHEIAMIEQAVHRTSTALQEMVSRLRGMAEK